MSNFSTKIASTVSVVALVATAMSASLVSAASEFLPYAELLADNSVIGTQTNESGYRLGANVTRAEMAKVTANLGGYTPTSCTGTTYGDVGAILGDLCGFIEALAEAGVVSTANANFRPSAAVTRAEATKMLIGAVGEAGSSTDAGYTDIANLGDLAMYINRANELGCAADATFFRPNATATRGESFKLAACIAGLEPVVPPTGTGTTGTGVVASGSVSVALEGAAVAQYVPYNASSVKVGSIKITAGAVATTVSSVVVTRSGLGNVAGISSLQLAQAGVAASDTRLMSTSSQSVTLKFTTPLVLAAGTSASYDVLVNLAGGSTINQNNQHQFTLTAVNVVGGTATGTPVTLGLLNTTSYSVGDVTVGNLQAGTMTSGKAAQTVVTTQITANRDATINGFTLTKSSGEDFTKVIANAKAYYNGAMVGTVTVTSDKITVTGLNIARLNGESASIEIKADGTYVGANTTIVFNVAQATDISATEKSTGYIMGVTIPLPTVPASITINGVDLTMTKVSTGSKTVAPGSSAVELYNVNITSDATFDISTYALKLATGDLTNFVDNKVTLYINGTDTEIIDATTAISTASGKVFSATADNFRVEPGVKVNVRVVGNVKTTASTGSTYKFNFALYQAKNVTNGQTVAITKSLDGDIITVNNGTFTVVKSPSTPTYKTVMEGSSVADLLWFDVRASAENQTLKSIKVTSSGAFDTYATKVALMQGTREIKSFTDSTNLALSAITFDTLSESLVKDTALPFSVRVTLKSGTVTTLGTSLKLSIAAPATDVLVGRSVNTSTATTTSSTVVTGNSYQVSSNAPNVTLPAQSMKNTTVQFVNVSNYDVEVQSITYEMTRNAASNGSYVTWSGTAKFLDAINGNDVGTTVGTIPGSVTTTFVSGDLTIAAAPLDRFVELVDSANTVQDDQYTLTVKSMTYVYKDRTTSAVSSPITESYTVSK